MTTPVPTKPAHVSLVHVVQLLIERNHLLDQHVDVDGRRPPVHRCPNANCLMWRWFIQDSGWMG